MNYFKSIYEPGCSWSHVQLYASYVQEGEFEISFSVCSCKCVIVPKNQLCTFYTKVVLNQSTESTEGRRLESLN